MNIAKSILYAMIVCTASAALAADQAGARLVGRILNDRSSREEHRLTIAALTDMDLSGESEELLSLVGEVMVESLHPNKTVDSEWLKKVCNGNLSLFGADGKGVQLATMSCGSGVLADYKKPGEWLQVSFKVPLSRLNGSKISKFELYMYNDTSKYKPSKDDGNTWTDGAGVKIRARNFRVMASSAK